MDKAIVMVNGQLSNGMTTDDGGNDTTELYIPLSKGNRTSAVLTVAINLYPTKDTAYNLLYPYHYQNYGFDTTLARGSWNARHVFQLFTEFDHELFGIDTFLVTDGRIWGQDETDSFYLKRCTGFTWGGSGRQGVVTETVMGTVCITYLPVYNSFDRIVADVLMVVGPVNHCGNFWVQDPEMPGPLAPIDGGGGGNAPIDLGDIGNIPLCPVAPRVMSDGPNHQLDPCNPGYVPITTEPVPFDPFVYDTIRYDPELRDSFPCIFSLLKNQLFNANGVVQQILYDNFSVGQFNHTYFTIDWNMTCSSPAVAVTDQYGTPSLVNDQSHWTDTIRLNPCYLQRSSKEFLMATILHEMAHAYINWCLAEYSKATPVGSGLIDSFYLKYHFPLHWHFLTNKPQLFHAAGSENAHQLIATNYTGRIASVVLSFSNPNAPLALRLFVAKNLAATGLYRTSAWGNAAGLTDTCMIKSVNYWGTNYKNVLGITLYQAGTPCNITDRSFRDSLQMSRADSCQ